MKLQDLWCWIGKHLDLLQFEGKILRTRCSWCGRQSPGITVE